MSKQEDTKQEVITEKEATSEEVQRKALEIVKSDIKAKFGEKKALLKKAAILTGVGIAGFLLGRTSAKIADYHQDNNEDNLDTDNEELYTVD